MLLFKKYMPALKINVNKVAHFKRGHTKITSVTVFISNKCIQITNASFADANASFCGLGVSEIYLQYGRSQIDANGASGPVPHLPPTDGSHRDAVDSGVLMWLPETITITYNWQHLNYIKLLNYRFVALDG